MEHGSKKPTTGNITVYRGLMKGDATQSHSRLMPRRSYAKIYRLDKRYSNYGLKDFADI